LLDAMCDAGLLVRFVPFDVSKQTLHDAAASIEREYPGVDVQPVVGDFTLDLDTIPRRGRRMVAFLGGTIGNLLPGARHAFLRDVAASLQDGDTFLLGTDLVKDVERLVAAYDDAQGVTAAFNKNVLSVMNTELDASFDADAFSHVARWDSQHEWIEMRLRAEREQVVPVRALGLDVRFDEGEEMRTEVSAKFRREGVERDLRAAGLELIEWWTDPGGDFALSLSRRSSGGGGR
jgi:L-histidine N-alpha-methyltransferase